ncbi:MAG TPA: Asp-tRNA(Asn)/Glu-tRNA(Gln) amidotransferase subunit GatB [Candidatus Nanoarchaeia archaeon]|nr:Asp-tRNA(Asn)/Glu-tRNA(Gln) amidotransferase subunit GatB [Candidatus Nanoarchaeia archaeon]
MELKTVGLKSGALNPPVFNNYEMVDEMKKNEAGIGKVKIGLEIHIQLNTDSKLFCGCPSSGNDAPNSRTCEVCLGMPGSKPVLNRKALEYAAKLCLALKCKINQKIFFSRKTYFYPDMSKNYQITQYELPLGNDGIIVVDGKNISITRIHLEEDPAALVHPSGISESSYVLVDYNRSGIPLVEIVTAPEIEGPEEARNFMKKILSILHYLNVYDDKKCVIKADVNVSVEESGFARVEIKNISGFKDIELALRAEIRRQRDVLNEGKKIHQETRGWDSEHGQTILLRTKETEEDYGYIADPDLNIIDTTPIMLYISRQIPELPDEKQKRFGRQYGIREEDAYVLCSEKKLADMFENIAKEVDAKLAAKWLRRELIRVLNLYKKEIREISFDETHLIDLFRLLQEKKITDATGQKIMDMLMEKLFDVKKYVEEQNLYAVSNINELEKFCKEAIAENPQAVADYKSGKEESLNFIVGSVMKKTHGKAYPVEVKKILMLEITKTRCSKLSAG